MRYPLLDGIHSPTDLRAMAAADLPALAMELRAFLIESVSATGGHLASNLGTIELTLALHYVFDTPNDTLCGMSGIRRIRTRFSLADAQKWRNYARPGGLQAFRVATKARLTHLAPGIPAPRFLPRWAWRRPSAKPDRPSVRSR